MIGTVFLGCCGCRKRPPAFDPNWPDKGWKEFFATTGGSHSKIAFEVSAFEAFFLYKYSGTPSHENLDMGAAILIGEKAVNPLVAASTAEGRVYCVISRNTRRVSEEEIAAAFGVGNINSATAHQFIAGPLSPRPGGNQNLNHIVGRRIRIETEPDLVNGAATSWAAITGGGPLDLIYVTTELTGPGAGVGFLGRTGAGFPFSVSDAGNGSLVSSVATDIQFRGEDWRRRVVRTVMRHPVRVGVVWDWQLF